MIRELMLGWIALVYIHEIITGWRYLVHMRTLNTQTGYEPSVTLLVPVKGMEEGLEKNLRSLTQQEYPVYQTVFIADKKEDPAYTIAKKMKRANDAVVIADSYPQASGKVAALLTGLQYAKGEVIAVADSDGFAQPSWLRSLVGPLQNPQVGVSTGYRWYQVTDWVSALRSAWNTIGLGMMGSSYSFVWGGSFALRKQDVTKWGIQQQWEQAVSDDVTVTKACRKNKKQIQFTPGALVTSYEPLMFQELMEWTNRQTWFVTHHFKKAWNIGVVLYGFGTLTLALGIGSLLASLVWPPGLLYGILLLLPQAGLLAKAWHRRRVFARFNPAIKLSWKGLFCELLVRPLSFYNLLRAKTLKSIQWRGRVYK